MESTDNGFNSIARRAFFIGDALLAVNGTTCTSVKQASNLLVNALKSTGIVSCQRRVFGSGGRELCCGYAGTSSRGATGRASCGRFRQSSSVGEQEERHGPENA